MVLEFQFPISCLNLPRILHFPVLDLCLQPIAVFEIRKIGDNKALCYHQRTQGKTVSQVVWNVAIDLARNDTSSVSHGLLKPDGGRTSVVRGEVDVKPGNVKSGAGVHSDGAEERGEEIYSVVFDSDKEDVPDDTEDIGQKHPLELFRLVQLKDKYK